MTTMLVLLVLLGLVGHSAIASATIDMALVPAGEFTMGSPTEKTAEQPAHRVNVDAFLMDKYEVSVGQYAKFLAAMSLEAPLDWNIMNQPPHQNLPVGNVDWTSAATYCKWLGKRLPTEAEWEKAARGTDNRLFPWGNDPPTPLRANYGKIYQAGTRWNNQQGLVPVGTLEDGKSPYGIYDMAGNVWEWVSDWYEENYYKNSPSKNPKGPSSGNQKVTRGGSWVNGPGYLRSASRDFVEPDGRYAIGGFRCAKSP